MLLPTACSNEGESETAWLEITSIEDKSLANTTLDADPRGEVIEFKVKSNAAWHIASSVDWIVPTPSDGKGSQSLRIEVESTSQSRSGVVIVQLAEVNQVRRSFNIVQHTPEGPEDSGGSGGNEGSEDAGGSGGSEGNEGSEDSDNDIPMTPDDSSNDDIVMTPDNEGGNGGDSDGDNGGSDDGSSEDADNDKDAEGDKDNTEGDNEGNGNNGGNTDGSNSDSDNGSDTPEDSNENGDEGNNEGNDEGENDGGNNGENDNTPDPIVGQYSIIDHTSELAEGIYFIGGYQDATLHLATEGMTVGHCNTTPYTLSADHDLIPAADTVATPIYLEASESPNGYYIRFSTQGYLTATAAGAGKLAFSNTRSHFWHFANHPDGGFILTQSGDIDVKLIISPHARIDALLRSVAGEEEGNAVLLFKHN